MEKTNQRNIMILFFTLVVMMIGFGIAIPVLPFYVEAFGAGGTELGLLMGIYALMQFLFSPLWGTLSDKLGRKPMIVTGVLGFSLSMLMFGLAKALWVLFVARALAGILSAATMPTAMAYISDSTTEEKRSGGMGLIGAAMGIGMVLGPGIGGMLGKDSLSLPFFVAAALAALALVMILLFLPESLPKEKRITGEKLQGPQLGVMAKALTGPIGVLLITAFLLSFGMTNFESVFGLYALERFHYDSAQVGMILMTVGVASALVQGVLTGPLTNRFGDVNVLRGAYLVSAIGFGIMLLAQNLTQIIITTMIFIMGNALLRPATASLISKRTDVSQGVAMGMNNSFNSLGRVFGPIWAGMIFDIHITYPYLSGAIIMAIGFVISIVWIKGKTTQSPADVKQSPT